MRNLRKLTAVVIAVALVLTSMTAAFAASGSYEFEDQATVLKDLGIWQGNTAGDLMLGEKLTRAQGAVLVLKTVLGKTDKDMEAADVSTIAKFADASEVPAWAEGWVALAVKEGVMKGGNNKLAAGDELKGKDLASMFMNALGFAAENEYATAVEKLAAKSAGKILAGIADDITDADLTRDAASAVVFDTLTVKAKDATKTVVDVLVGTDATKKAVAVKAGLIAAPTTLDVAKVEALNLRELVVTFNGPVTNVDDAKKTSNYKIGTNEPEAATLSDDKTTVTLRTASDKAMGNYAADIELTVLKAVGFAADKTIKGISVKDTTVPYAVSVKTTGPNNIKVVVSEPLRNHDGSGFTKLTGADIASSIKIDGGILSIDTLNTNASGSELNIKTYSTLGEGSHKIEFLASGTKLFDNAGYQIQASTLTFDYVKDTSPLAFEVVSSNETSVTIKFNKAIVAGSFGKHGATAGNSNVNVYHTYNNSSVNKVNGADVTTEDDQKFVIDFTTAHPFPPSTVNVYISYDDAAGKMIEDNYGNKLAATSFTVSTTADVTKPTVSSVVFKDYNKVEVTFSEGVDETTAQDPSNYILKAGNDSITVNGAARSADNKSVVTLSTATMNGGSYTLTVKKVKDLSVAKNTLDDVTVSFTGTDKVAPSVEDTKSGLVSENKFKVVFSEAMDAATITDKSIYKFGATESAAAALKDVDTVEAIDGNKAVIITFKTAPTGATGVVLVTRAKDVAGNWVDKFQTPITFTPGAANVKPVGLKEFEITSKTTLKLKIEDTIKDMLPSDFIYYKNAADTTGATPKSIAVSILDGVTYITLETNDLGVTVGDDVSVATAATVAAKSVWGTPVKIDKTSGAIDKCAPATAKENISLTFVDDKNATSSKLSLGTVAIKYSEPIYAASVQDSDFTVAGYEIDKVVVVNDTVTITLKNVDFGAFTALETAKIQVKQVGEIQDNAKNTLGAQSAWEVSATVAK